MLTVLEFFYQGFIVQRYKIERIYRDSYFGTAEIGVRGSQKTFYVSGKCINNLKIGGKFNVISDKMLGMDDRVYMFRGGYCLPVGPVGYDKFSCKCYLEDLPGLFDSFKLDRIAFKVAIARECFRHDCLPSLVAWRNLRKVCLLRAYAPLMRCL